MIIEYSCKNFRSIGDNITFSMLASTDKSLLENCYNFKNLKILKEAVIYGANGSGKSNFIKSLTFLKMLVVNSKNHNPGDKIRVFKNKRMLNNNTEYSIHFISNGTRYYYGFSYNENNIVDEFLYYYPNDKEAKIFDRQSSNITYGESFRKELKEVENDYLKENRLLLSCAADRKNIKEIVDVYLFFNVQLVTYGDLDDWSVYSANAAANDSNLRQLFIDFMHNIGKKDLLSINSRVENKTIPSNLLPQFLTPEAQLELQNKPIQTPIVKFIYRNFELDITEESEGIQKLFGFFFPFIDMILKHKILICDEFETHLHPLLVKELISLFKNNSTESQLLFTTHDINLLNLDIFRRDQIWFTETNLEGFTDLYSLAELKSVRKDENISKNYILGKYSGVPMINEGIKLSIIKELVKNE